MVLLYFITVAAVALAISACVGGTLGQHLGVFSLDLVLDFYSNTFLLLLFLISTQVLVWSYYYIDIEANYRRFLSLVILFLCAIFLLVFCCSLYGALIGWDGLGVTSFLLVIYFKNRNSLGSGIITVLSNRIGDCFLLILLAVQFTQLYNSYVFTVLLLLTSITNSAQMPFSSWLPAAIAAPTPVSALVHSSTLVTAGIYLLLRFNNMGTEWIIAVGSITIVIAGLCACAEIDLNKIVALSTLSQLGVIMVALSIKLNVLCFFHLITHAIFNALLFISVGIGIHSVYGTQDFRSFAAFSGVSALPSLSLTIANTSLAGFPFIAGYYSNDAILESFYNSNLSFFLLMIFLVGVGLTTTYCIKMTSLAILGGYSGGSADLNGGGSSWFAKVPLAIISICAVSAGGFLSASLLELSPYISVGDNLMPLAFIISGVLFGMHIEHLKHPFLSQMWYLTPTVQGSSVLAVAQSQVGDLDRGVFDAILLGATQRTLWTIITASRWLLLVVLLVLITLLV